MCLTIAETTREKARTRKKNPNIATKAFTVFKVVENWKGVYHSPYMSSFIWEEGKTYTSKFSGNIEKADGASGLWWLHIDKGLHANVEAEKAMNTAYYARNRRIIEMVVPKGAQYFINKKGEVAADTMKFPKGAKIYTTTQFKKAFKL